MLATVADRISQAFMSVVERSPWPIGLALFVGGTMFPLWGLYILTH